MKSPLTKSHRPILALLIVGLTLLGCDLPRVIPLTPTPLVASPTLAPPVATPATATPTVVPPPTPTASAVPSFHFVFTADSRDGYATLAALSRQMAAGDPAFVLFGGDLCTTFDLDCINRTWKPAMNGIDPGTALGQLMPGNGMLARTFAVRGNHDSGALSDWRGLWDFAGAASRVGATCYTARSSDASYSFDYRNSHFVILDNPDGDIDTLTSGAIAWLDSDLAAAERRGVLHAFLFTHAPIYGVTSQHGSAEPSPALQDVLSRHSISAAFAGHEHVTQYTHVMPGILDDVGSFQEFTLGRAGAPGYAVVKYSDWHADQDAFADVLVSGSGSDFAVAVYSQDGSVLFAQTFTR